MLPVLNTCCNFVRALSGPDCPSDKALSLLNDSECSKHSKIDAALLSRLNPYAAIRHGKVKQEKAFLHSDGKQKADSDSGVSGVWCVGVRRVY